MSGEESRLEMTEETAVAENEGTHRALEWYTEQLIERVHKANGQAYDAMVSLSDANDGARDEPQPPRSGGGYVPEGRRGH